MWCKLEIWSTLGGARQDSRDTQELMIMQWMPLDIAWCQCPHSSLGSGQDAGMWGGMSEDERRALTRRTARDRPVSEQERATRDESSGGAR